MRCGGASCTGARPRANLEFNAQGKLRHAHLERGVAMDSEELSQQAGQPQRLSRHWRSPVADVDFRDSGHGQIEPAAMHGTRRRGGDGREPARQWAGVAFAAFGRRGDGRVWAGFGVDRHERDWPREHRGDHRDGSPADHQRRPAGGAFRRSRSGRSESRAQSARPGSEGEIQSATVEGHVVLTQSRPRPSPARRRRRRCEQRRAAPIMQAPASGCT